jgi:hypothetical protein
MKQQKGAFMLALFFLLGFVFSRCSEKKDLRKSFKDSRAYNDFITKEVVKIDSLYLGAMHYQNEKASLEKSKTLETRSLLALQRLNIQPFKGDSSLCVAAEKIILHFHSISQKEMPAFFHLCYSMCKKEQIAKKAAQINRSATYLDDEYDKQWKGFSLTQRTFSKKFNLNLK